MLCSSVEANGCLPRLNVYVPRGRVSGQRKSAPRRECSKGAARYRAFGSSPNSGIFATRTNQRVSVASGMRLFKQQRTRSAQWATDKGFATGIQDFVLPAGAVVNFLI